MDLNDVARRVFGQHRGVILFLVVLGIASGLLFHAGKAGTYTASTRLVLDTADPKDRAEALAIADTAKAIATSPSQVRGALADAHVTGRNPLDVAEHHVTIRGLGTSAILQLEVSDRDRRVAAAVANALADRVIRTRLAASRGEFQLVLPKLDERIDALNTKIAALDTEIDSVSVAAAAGSGQTASALRARRDALTRSRDSFAQQRALLESERVSLLSQDALRPKASVISRAVLPTHRDPSRWLSDAVLGAILGLVLGVGVAAAIETLRPTLVGGESLASELDVPLLGTLAALTGDSMQEDLTLLRAKLRLAGEAADSEAIFLLGADPSVDLGKLARELEAAPADVASAGARTGVADTHAPRAPLAPRPGEPRETSVPIRPLEIEHLTFDHGERAGVVLVSPTALRKSQLLDISQVLRLTSAPLLGLITYTAPRLTTWPWAKSRRRDSHAPQSVTTG